MKYTVKQIAAEIQATAQGDAYYGNALRVAKDLPGMTQDERHLLDKYASGYETPEDRFKLQDLANKIGEMV